MNYLGVRPISFAPPAPYLGTEEWELPFNIHWRALMFITWWEAGECNVGSPSLKSSGGRQSNKALTDGEREEK